MCVYGGMCVCVHTQVFSGSRPHYEQKHGEIFLDSHHENLVH